MQINQNCYRKVIDDFGDTIIIRQSNGNPKQTISSSTSGKSQMGESTIITSPHLKNRTIPKVPTDHLERLNEGCELNDIRFSLSNKNITIITLITFALFISASVFYRNTHSNLSLLLLVFVIYILGYLIGNILPVFKLKK